MINMRKLNQSGDYVVKKQTKAFLATVILTIPLLANAEQNQVNVTDNEDVPLKKPTKEDFNWSIKPKLLTGVMYFKHITLDPVNLSNKPVPFGGIGLNINVNNWFINGYALDTAKTNDHVFDDRPSLVPGQIGRLSEANYKFQRQDYAVTIGREITDWLFTDSKRWGISLFAGYRHGKTVLESINIAFNEKNATDGIAVNDRITLGKGEYTVKGPMGGIGLRIQPFEKSNSQLGLTIGYGPLKGTYTRTFTYPIANTPSNPSEPASNTVNTWVTALNWEGQLTPNLSYSLVVDYYAYSMPIQQKSIAASEIKEAVSSLKLFLNYRF